jgi:hypothetical protein
VSAFWTRRIALTVTLKDINFVRRSTVEFRGKRAPTQAVSSTELKLTLDAEAMKQAGRVDLVVIDPAPTDTFFTRGMWGSGTSNLAHIVVNYRY